MAPLGLEIADDYDMVMHIDGDAVVVGDLSEMIESDAAIIGTKNNNAFGKAGSHRGITTPLLSYDSENDCYVPQGSSIPIETWLNAGIIGANGRDFWKAWDDLNMSIVRRGVGRLPPPFGDENDTLNLIFHSGRFSTHLVDSDESDVYYNIATLWGDDPNDHWESWRQLYMKGDGVFLDDPVSGTPKQVKILHQAGGSLSNTLNKEHGGFRNWLRQAVPREVGEFIDHVSSASSKQQG